MQHLWSENEKEIGKMCGQLSPLVKLWDVTCFPRWGIGGQELQLNFDIVAWCHIISIWFNLYFSGNGLSGSRPCPIIYQGQDLDWELFGSIYLLSVIVNCLVPTPM